jgi:uncharacterized protein (UPF0261 family)
VKFIIPQKGFSSLSVKGGALYDLIAENAFVSALGKYLDPEIKIVEVNTDINNSQFAQTLVESL